jgi:hypothetical protein
MNRNPRSPHKEQGLKDESFKPRFVAFAIGAMAISLRETSPNSARKEAFAKRKL